MQLKQGLESVNRHRFLKFRCRHCAEQTRARAAPCKLSELEFGIAALYRVLDKPGSWQVSTMHFCNQWRIPMGRASAPLPTCALWKFFWRRLHLQPCMQFQEQNSNAFLSLAYVPNPLPSKKIWTRPRWWRPEGAFPTAANQPPTRWFPDSPDPVDWVSQPIVVFCSPTRVIMPNLVVPCQTV